jgi:hypothetical protein
MDVPLGAIGLNRENKSLPNPLAGNAVGNALGVDPNARLGVADVVSALSPGKVMQGVQGVGLVGSAIEHPLETAAIGAGLIGGQKALGAAARRVGPALAEEAAGQLLGKTPMPAMMPSGQGLPSYLQEALDTLRQQANLPQNAATVDKIIDLASSGKMANEIGGLLGPADRAVLGRLSPDALTAGANVNNAVRSVRNAFGIPSQQSGQEAADFADWIGRYRAARDAGTNPREAALQAGGFGKPTGPSAPTRGAGGYREWAPQGSAWEEIPEGTVQPNGLEFRMGMEEGGKRYARWPEGKAPEQASPIGADDAMGDTGDKTSYAEDLAERLVALRADAEAGLRPPLTENDYKGLFSTGTKTPLKRGETWESRAESMAASASPKAYGLPHGPEQLADEIRARERTTGRPLTQSEIDEIIRREAEAEQMAGNQMPLDELIADLEAGLTHDLRTHQYVEGGTPLANELRRELGSRYLAHSPSEWGHKAFSMEKAIADELDMGSTLSRREIIKQINDRLDGKPAPGLLTDVGGVGGLPPRKPPAPPTGAEPPMGPWGPNPGLPKQPPPIPKGAKPIDLTEAEEIARLRPEKFQQVPKEIFDEIARAAKTVDFAREQRRGVIPDAVSEQMADDLGRGSEQWIRGGKAGKAYNAEEIRALNNVVTTQAATVARLRQEIASAPNGTDRDTLFARQAAESSKLWGLVQVAEGAKGEAGRALRAYQAQRRLLEIDPGAAAQKLYQRLGGREKAQQAFDEYQKLMDDGADPIQLARFWAKVEAPPAGISDWFTALRYNSMLSGPRTFEINAIGNAMEIPWRLARDLAASVGRGRPEEMLPELAGLWVGMQKGSNAFMQTLLKGASEYRALGDDVTASLADRVDNPVGKKIANALEVPARVLQASDDFARMTAYSMALSREAATAASRKGLRGDRWKQEVADLLANPTVQMQRRALGVADRMTYQSDMGRVGQGLQRVRQLNPALGNILVPFLRTVYNITGRGIDRSPVGFVGTAIDLAKGKYKDPDRLEKGLVPLGERVGDNIMGGLAGIWFLNQAMQGNISGPGPDDAQKRDMMRAQGWTPYSIKVGDAWVSYSNWGPVALPLSMAAAAAEGLRYRKPDDTGTDTAMDVFGRFGKLATDQPFLQGIGAIYRSVSEPERYGAQWLTNLMTTLVPYGAALNTAAQAGDALQRTPDKNDFGQALQARLPGQRQNVPATKDVLGRPVENVQTGAGAFQPFRASKERPAPNLQEFSRLGVDIPVTMGKEVGGTKLSDKDARRYQELTQDLRGRMTTALMATPAYKQADDEGKKKMLRAATDRAQAWAAQDIMPGETDAKGNAREGTEWLTRTVGKSPDKAIAGYLKALETQQELAELRKTRFRGVAPEDADQVAKDKALISTYRGILGEDDGDRRARQELGYTRFSKARRARENPRYARLAKRLQSDETYMLYMRTGPSVLVQSRPSAVQMEDML